MTLRFSPWFKSSVANVWRKACGPMPCVLIRDFLKYFFTKYQTVPREILRFRQDMNNALVRFLRLLCFKYALSSILAESASGRMFTSPPFRCNRIVD